MTNDTYVDPADMDDAAALTLEWGDIEMTCKVTENTVNPLLGTRTIKFVPYEDSIHPYPLAFDPPLIEHAVGDNDGFAHHWEKLNYAFALPNPAAFPELTTLTDDDKALLWRYVAVCRQLAGYSALNNESGINIKGVNGGQPDIELEFPTPEAFGGTSLAFRQLHSDDEPASFSRTKGRLMQAIKLLPEAERDAAKDVVVQWARARAKLMNRLLQNIVCEMASPPVTSGPRCRRRDLAATLARRQRTRSAAASRTCSQLSNTNNRTLPSNAAATLSATVLPGCWVMPSTAATASGTAAGSATAANSKTHTPSGNSSASRAATSNASRVLPTPPTPVNVTNR
jgi:hypothetical protein